MENTVPADCTSAEPLRRCRDCSEIRPISEFRKRSGSSHLRFRHCRECANRRVREWRAARKAADRREFLDESLRRLRRQQTVAARTAIVDEIAAAFGDPGEVGLAFGELLQAAKERGHQHTRRRLLQSYLCLSLAVAQSHIFDEDSESAAPTDFKVSTQPDS
jgi:hypothetical protein